MTPSPPAPQGAGGKRDWKRRYRAGLEWLQLRMDQWWYLPCVALCSGIDNFLLCFPTDIFLVTTSALRPKRWLRIALFIAVGSALGTLAFAYAVDYGGPAFRAFANGAASTPASATSSSLARYSALALFLVAANPLVPPQPVVAAAVLAGMSPLEVFVWILAGRTTKYCVYAFAAGRAPRYVSRWIRPVGAPATAPGAAPLREPGQ
jgi:membrane protein YqaA with SNARE-associated domain